MNVNWKDLVKGVAPVLATALGSPAAGLAAKAITGALLGDDNATDDIEAVSAAVLGATPEQLAMLKKADNDFDVQMKELDFKFENARLGDVKGARDLAKANMLPQIVLSAVFVLGYFYIVYLLVGGDVTISTDQSPLINVLLGVLTAGVASIMQFWFGSSSGSKEKTNKLKGR